MNAGDQLGHYTIVSPLGEGGMGAVYRATDATLGRDVALKVLPPEVASHPDRLERFRREARALAALNHPNIVTVYSVEEADGVIFLTMELVAGQSLDRVIAGGPLAVERVTQIGRELCDAFGAAHEKGIVHRDLKPANVVLNQTGAVKVLDFGLAKVETSDDSGDAALATNLATGLATEFGTLLGTPAYMSPEQLSGQAVDPRTDIYSLGVLLYELATGRRPFSGRSTAELTSSILRDAPQSVADLRPTVPPALVSVIAKCLQKDADARFTTMADVRSQLAGDAAATARKAPSVAVLPFRNLSADPENEFFGDGLAEEILNALAQIQGLRVAARTSAFSFKGQATDIAQIGAKLHVATVLEGSVRRAGNRVRVTVQLVDVTNGFQLWSERYDREMADIFDVQDEIARAIADKLEVTLAASRTTRLVKQATTNLQAYELYLRGRALLLKRGKGAEEGLACLRRAVELDSSFAAAWAGLADAYTVAGYWGSAPPAETMPKALTAARRALELDAGLAEGHCALATALLLWDRDYAAADTAYRRCVELNPQYTQGRCWHAVFNLAWVQGRLDEGVSEARRALEEDPLSAYAASLLGLSLAAAGQTGDGLEFARVATQRDPDALLTQWIHQIVAHWHGALEESMAAFEAASAGSGRVPYPLMDAAVMQADRGHLAEARALHEELQAMSRRAYVSNIILAMVAAAAGESDQAMDLARQACDEREPLLILVARNFPDARRLREDPRFDDILRRLAYPGLTLER